MVAKRKEAEPKRHIQCAHEQCPHSAIVSMKLKTGRANLCRAHYEFHITQEAREVVESKGLITTEQKREYCRRNMPKFEAREPGQEG